MTYRFADPMLALPRPAKRSLALAVDALLCAFCVWLAFCLRLETFAPLHGVQWWVTMAAVVLALPLFAVCGLYRAIFRYAGGAALAALVVACGILTAEFLLVFTFIGVPGVPRSMGLTIPLLIFVTVGASRLVARYWLGGSYMSALTRQSLPQVLIYGAGSAGKRVAEALTASREMAVRAFIDDARDLRGSTLNGLPIYPPSELQKLVAEHGITDLLLALPSISRARRAEIVQQIQKQRLKLHVRTLPDLIDIAQGRVQIQDLRELDIEDLLGRDPVAPNEELLQKNIRGKRVLVTGAGGSIGSELCRQIARQHPHTLLLLDVSEFALYAIHHELQQVPGHEATRLRPLLASVRDEARMREILSTWQPDTVYHAAAYKHVPMVEHNPAEGVRNNTLGTLTTARVAAECGVTDFVLVSTDKAVRPTNVMGASKRLAEMVLQALATIPSADGKPATRFSMVRFGNVLGSSGSVVPLFRQQIRNGGPITLTHADITRYFMTIPEAAQLVIQAGAMATGGDVFVLDMGEPVRIIDLARRMVELSGMTVRDDERTDGDIAIAITGLRPGEKLYEELLIGDNPQPTSHPRIMKANEEFIPWPELSQRLRVLSMVLDVNDVPVIRQMLEDLVGGYQPGGEVVDWIHLEHYDQAGLLTTPNNAPEDLAPALEALNTAHGLPRGLGTGRGMPERSK
ncbi:polysaccharide biosynthesis protein [Acidovorax sp. Be4]|uniref:Polysaccharide biosynthesis protein n=1 Tax=Acidovorax bellezanensis TaxID=2976702 RepID=A0ABT2PGV6_9BURK|nr:nucleoside-diphosphate sugar epimerase/dehydratase [Acidovorax sp. Be4]MCT9809665.1 polysaccharide biosynthesis protein [Acidovorax sp. Be4]